MNFQPSKAGVDPGGGAGGHRGQLTFAYRLWLHPSQLYVRIVSCVQSHQGLSCSKCPEVVELL